MISYEDFKNCVDAKTKGENQTVSHGKKTLQPYEYFERRRYLWDKLIACWGGKKSSLIFDSYLLNQSGLFWKSSSMRTIEITSYRQEEIPMTVFLGAVTDEPEVTAKTLNSDSWLDYDVFQGAVLTFDIAENYTSPISFPFITPSQNSRLEELKFLFHMTAMVFLSAFCIFCLSGNFLRFLERYIGKFCTVLVIFFLFFLLVRFFIRGQKTKPDFPRPVDTKNTVLPELKKKVHEAFKKIDNMCVGEITAVVFYQNKLYVALDLICEDKNIFDCDNVAETHLKLFYRTLKKIADVGEIIRKEIGII